MRHKGRKIEKLLQCIFHPKFAYHRVLNGVPLDHLLHLSELKRLGLLDDVKTVIDAGAHNGVFSKAIAVVLPKVRVLAFEPSKPTFERLKVGIKKFNNIEIYNLALGSINCRLNLAKSSLEESNSLLKITKKHTNAWPESNPTSSEEVEVRTIKEFFPAPSRSEGILLKADVQGYELEILKGAGDILNSVVAIQIECSFVPLYENSPLMGELLEFLYERGFKIVNIFDLLSPPGSQEVVSCDAFFVRDRCLRPSTV
ncbi:MAG: hypothetical protein RL077_668 [Verrucomicrobiota bacterium]|jgi:FkbM family methyltransferase